MKQPNNFLLAHFFQEWRADQFSLPRQDTHQHWQALQL